MLSYRFESLNLDVSRLKVVSIRIKDHGCENKNICF